MKERMRNTKKRGRKAIRKDTTTGRKDRKIGPGKRLRIEG